MVTVGGYAWEGGWAPEGLLKRFISYTSTIISGLTPNVTGEAYYDSTNAAIAVSTGTALNAFGLIKIPSAGTTSANTFTLKNIFSDTITASKGILTSTATFTGALSMGVGQSIVTDGVGGNSYYKTNANDITQFYTNGTKNFEIGTTSITAGLAICYKNGGQGIKLLNDSYIGFNDGNAPIIMSNSVDTNAIGLQILLRAGGNYTTTLMISDMTDSYLKDYGFFDGITDPSIALISADEGDYTRLTTTNNRVFHVKVQGIDAVTANINSMVIKSTTTAGLIGTTPISVGEIYYNTTSKTLAISTGTVKGNFGSITIGILN